jgi:hypothetical protein
MSRNSERWTRSEGWATISSSMPAILFKAGTPHNVIIFGNTLVNNLETHPVAR